MGGFLDRQIDSLKRWLTEPDKQLSRWERAAKWFVELCRHGLRELKHDKAGQMAAALTYHTLFSLLPTLVIMLVVMAAFVGPDDREKVKQTVLDWLLAPISAEETPGPLGGMGVLQTDPNAAAVEGARPDSDIEDAAVANDKQREFEEARAEIKKKMDEALEQLENVSFRSIGAIGLLIFIYGATGLLATIEKSFNEIYAVNRSRPWYVRIPLYYTVITLGPLVLLAGQWAQGQFLDLIAAASWTKWFAGPLVVLSPLLTTWLVLTLMYKLLPNTKVKFRAAMAGGFIAAVIWGVAIVGLKMYVGNTKTTGVYGAMFLLPLFLLWVWVTWLIVLFGLEVAYSIQAMKGRQFKHIDHASKQLVMSPTMLLPVMSTVSSAFGRGKTLTVDALAESTGFADHAVERMVEALRGAGLLHRVDDSEPPEYALARSADQITAGDVLAVGESMLPESASANGDPAWKLVGKLRRHDHQLADETTLAELTETNDNAGRTN